MKQKAGTDQVRSLRFSGPAPAGSLIAASTEKRAPRGRNRDQKRSTRNRRVAGVEDSEIAVVQGHQKHPAEKGEKPGPVADQQAERAEGGNREEEELHPPEPAHHVQGHQPRGRAGGNPAQQVRPRQHPRRRSRRRAGSVSRAARSTSSSSPSRDAEEGQRPQVEAEALLPAAEQVPEPGGGRIRG